MDKEFFAMRKFVMRWIDRMNARPSYPWRHTVLGSFLSIPGLRGFWPMSSFDGAGHAQDMSQHNRHLTNTGQAQYTYSASPAVAPIASFDGTNDYMSVGDNADHDITGTETYVGGGSQGLTIGGWFAFSTLSQANNKGIIGKWNGVAGGRSYLLHIPNGTSTARFLISVDGTTSALIVSTYTLSTDTWYFIVGRYLAGTPEMNITINGSQTQDSLAVGVPASIWNGTASFEVMSYNAGAASQRNHGFASYCFLAAQYLNDNQLNHLYEMSRGMFGA